MRKITLKGPRIVLRPIKYSDAPNYVRWLKDKKIIRFLGTQTPITLAEEKKYIRKLYQKGSNYYTWALINEQGKHIGSTGIELNKDNKWARFGILIGERRQWGKGYAKECIQVLGDYVFKTLKYNRLELFVYAGNKGGIKAYQKAGFKKEGVRKRRHWNKVTKKWDDEVMMGILKEEWGQRIYGSKTKINKKT